VIAAIGAVLVLWAAGLLPAVALTTDAARGLAVAPLVGGLLATVAGLASVASGAPPVPCFAAIVVIAGATAWRRVRRRGTSLRPGRLVAGHPWWLMVGVGVVLALPLTVVARAGIDWDAQSIWSHKATWFAEGGSRAREAFGAPQSAFSHPDYPPLLPAAAGVVSATTGRPDIDTSHQAVTAALVWSALAVLTLEIMAVGRRGARSWPLVACLTSLAACSFGALRLANGEADALWSIAAVAAGLGLLRRRDSPADLVVPALACLVAMLTKNEGLATGTVIVVGAVAVQWRHRARWWLLALPVASAGAALLMRSWAADPEPVLRFAHETVRERAGRAVEAVWHVLDDVAAPALVASALVLAVPGLRRRWRSAVGAVVACWGVVVASLLPLIWTYARGPHEIRWWLATSVDRTTIAAYVALVVIIGVVAGAGLESPGPPAPEAASEVV